MMKTLTIAFLVLALAHNAAASRLLKQQYSVPLLRGTAQPQQATPEYNRYGRGAGDLLQNVVQGETQRGITDSQATVVLQTDVAGHQNAAVRDAVGQNQAQALVSGAANGGPREIAKEAFGNVQYQVHGQGLALNSDTRTALANNDAQRIIQASIDNGDAFTAAQGGSDNAFATVFGDRTHLLTN